VKFFKCSWVFVFLCTFLMFSICLPSTIVQAEPVANFKDIENHWAVRQISDWLNKDLVGGYTDGTFKPDNSITRAEFIALVNRAFGFTETVPVAFSDVRESDWYALEVAKASAIGYIAGYPDGSFKPNNSISRQEAAAVLAKVLKPKATQDKLAQFIDNANIPNWSRSAINAIVGQGYMGGYPDNSFKALNPITRAEAIAVLDRAVGALYNKAGVYDLAGAEIGSNVTISSTDVILKNAVISGNLYLTEGIGDGHVTLDNVQVEGDTKVSGGGENSIIIINSSLGRVVIDTTGRQNVRLVAQGSTTIGTVEAESGTKLEEENLTGNGFEEVIIAVPAGASVELIGDFDEVNIESPHANINVGQGSIQNITLAPATQGTVINLDAGATVNTFTAHSATQVTGTGTIQTANINANGVNMDIKPTTIAVAEGVVATVAGEIIKGDTPAAPVTEERKSSSGGGGKRVAVSAISITTEPDKTVYKLGEELDLTGLVVTATYTDGTTKIVEHSKLTVSGFDNETVGEQQITVTYEGKTATFVVNVVEDPEEPTEANFISTGDVGIAPDTAGEAAGKIYAEYKLVANEEDISLAASNIEYIKVKVGEDGEWKDLTANTDATLWFNVEADQGVRYYEVKTKDGKVYTATLNWDKEINTTATWEATGKEGIRPGTEDTYVEYKLMDGENQVSLKIGDVKLIASKEGEKWVELEPNTDETLWFNKAHETGSYDFFIVTSDGTMYKVTLDWVETIAAAVDYKAVWNESRGTWYIKVTVPEEKLDKDSVQSIHVIKEAGEELDEPRALTPDTDKVMWFGVAKADGEVTLKADGEYAYKVVRTDGSEYIFSFDYAANKVQGVEEVEEPIETIEAIIDYNAVWNESRGTWYIKVTVPDENLDAGSVKSIHAITEAGEELDEPRALTPDTDKVMWFGVAKGDGGTWNATGRTGFNTVDGKAYVFQEFELLVDGERISLHKDNIKSITSNGKALTPNTDHTLWFNVLAEAGEREFVVVDKNDVTYKATLNWTAPAEVTATAEGAPIYNESLGATYQKYNVEGVSLVGFDAMYQIKPSGEISKLVESGDDCLWFKVDADEEGWAQEEGDHIFLVKHGETWSQFTVNYKAEEEPEVVEGTWNATGRTGFNTVDGKAYVFQEFELLVEGERISLHKDNIKSITSNGKALTPNTDHTLWFNVLAEAGEREFVVVDNNDVTYKATLNWTAPAEVPSGRTPAK
jgi:hypothetical protein